MTETERNTRVTGDFDSIWNDLVAYARRENRSLANAVVFLTGRGLAKEKEEGRAPDAEAANYGRPKAGGIE
jgi:hypothetical protein